MIGPVLAASILNTKHLDSEVFPDAAQDFKAGALNTLEQRACVVLHMREPYVSCGGWPLALFLSAGRDSDLDIRIDRLRALNNMPRGLTADMGSADGCSSRTRWGAGIREKGRETRCPVVLLAFKTVFLWFAPLALHPGSVSAWGRSRIGNGGASDVAGGSGQET